MMGYKTVAQVVMVIASLFLVFSVIMPKLDSIKLVENKALQYQDAAAKASEYNRSLAVLVNKKNSFTTQELEKLERYLPSSVDTISVMADIKNLADTSGLNVLSLTSETAEDTTVEDEVAYGYDEESGDEYVIDDSPTKNHVDFVLNAQGYYTGLKTLLTALEYNDYPLEVVSISFAVGGSDSESEVTTEPVFTYAITLRAYSFTH